MDQYVEVATFTPRDNGNQDELTRYPEEPTSAQPSHLPHRKASATVFPPTQTSPFRPFPRRGRTVPTGNISLNTKLKPAWSVFTSPGSFEQLYNERAYLAASLRSQGQRSMELMRRLSILQDRIDNGLPSDERRKSRKKTALLKSKVTEAAAQEKAITLRMLDIHQELQSRERWMQVQQEIYEGRYSWWPMDSPSTGYMTSPSDLMSVVSTPLDAVSPVFFPVACYPVYNSWDMLPSCHPPEIHTAADSLAPESWADNEEMCETEADVLGNCGLQFDYDARGSPSHDTDVESGEAVERGIHQTHRRRTMSLPSLRCLWPGLQDS